MATRSHALLIPPLVVGALVAACAGPPFDELDVDASTSTRVDVDAGTRQAQPSPALDASIAVCPVEVGTIVVGPSKVTAGDAGAGDVEDDLVDAGDVEDDLVDAGDVEDAGSQVLTDAGDVEDDLVDVDVDDVEPEPVDEPNPRACGAFVDGCPAGYPCLQPSGACICWSAAPASGDDDPIPLCPN